MKRYVTFVVYADGSPVEKCETDNLMEAARVYDEEMDYHRARWGHRSDWAVCLWDNDRDAYVDWTDVDAAVAEEAQRYNRERRASLEKFTPDRLKGITR